MASREMLRELARQFHASEGQSVEVEAVGGVEVAKRIRAGERVDLVVLARDTIDSLAQEGFVLSGSITDIAQSGIAVAVPAGSSAPDLRSEATVRAAVLAAAGIGYSTGPSGVYLKRKFESWGILSQIEPRLVVAPPGVPVGSLVAQGRVQLGFQQLSELINLEGIVLAGSLPAEMQLLTTFSGAVAGSSIATERAGRLLDYMASPETDALKRRCGMQHPATA